MQYLSTITWKHEANSPFNAKSYDRTHKVTFGGGSNVTASSAPEYLGKAELPNPEELFTASLSSCFMLTFLYLAAMKGLIVEEYVAEAAGTLGKNAEGKMAMTEVVIKPKVQFQSEPEKSVLEDLYKKAHDNCFISSSVKTKVTIAG